MLRKFFLIALLITPLSACAPQATPTTAPVATAVPATQAPATQAPTEAATQAPTAAPTAAFPMSFTDGLGRKVDFDQAPQRILSMAPSNTEILFAIGAGSQVVGR